MRDDGEYIGAADLLHSLLWSRLAPKYFWVTLLIDSIPFLTADQVQNIPFLTADQVQNIIYPS